MILRASLLCLLAIALPASIANASKPGSANPSSNIEAGNIEAGSTEIDHAESGQTDTGEAHTHETGTRETGTRETGTDKVEISKTNTGKRIAITFDDIPRESGAFFTPEQRTKKLIAAMHSVEVEQAAFFVTPGRLSSPYGAGGEGRIKAYAAAGHVIANHSFSHHHLQKVPASEYLADIDRAAAWLKGREGYRPWFRYPYLDDGGKDTAKRDTVRRGLDQRGLRQGYVTISGSDWKLETLTIQAKKSGTPMDQSALRELYLQSQLNAVEHYDTMARRVLGRSPAHVLLLHETDLAALYIDDLVIELRRNGWTIVSADEAFADPLRFAQPDLPNTAGSLIGVMAAEKSIDPPLSPIWMTTGMIEFLFKKRVLQKSKL